MLVIKNQKEIDLMRKSGEVLALVMEELQKNLEPGIKTIELDRIAEATIRKYGGEPSFKGYKVPALPPFPGSICASINSEVVHGIPDNRKLCEGDIVSIDIGVFLNGYHADAARTFAVGKISDEAQNLINVTRDSFFEGIKHAYPSKMLGDISSAIQECVESNGYSVVRDFVGHGIGQVMHEEPQIPNYRTERRGPRLSKGMTLAIEPMVNIGTHEVKVLKNRWTVVTKDGKLSAHYENTIAITDGEPLILTKLG
jgi:methionyl aminopeptidase